MTVICSMSAHFGARQLLIALMLALYPDDELRTTLRPCNVHNQSQANEETLVEVRWTEKDFADFWTARFGPDRVDKGVHELNAVAYQLHEWEFGSAFSKDFPALTKAIGLGRVDIK
jgi:hypothetical protein